MNQNEFAELTAGYALHALSPSDRAAFEAALAEHPEWAEHVRADLDTVALLAEAVADVAPPRAARDELLALIAQTSQPDADAAEEDFAAAGPAPTGSIPTQTGAKRRWGRGWFALAASFVILLALGFGAVVIGQQLARPAAVVALEQIESAPDARQATVAMGSGGTATAHWSSSRGQAVLVSEGLPALNDAQTFELWFVREGEPLSAGTFSAESGAATAMLAGEFEPGDVIALTVEPAGGAPDGVPSSAPLMAIETA